MGSAIAFPRTYPFDSDLSLGYRYPAFEQLAVGLVSVKMKYVLSYCATHKRIDGQYLFLVHTGISTPNLPQTT